MVSLTEVLMPEGDWRRSAKCRGEDPDTFFPVSGELLDDVKAICAGCPVRDDCLEHALTHREAFGIWGGTSARERRRLRAQRVAS